MSKLRQHHNFFSKKAFSILFVLLGLLFIQPIFGQTKRQLESKRKKLRSEIKKINKLLSKSQKNEETVLIQLIDINKKITVHEKIINTIQKERKVFTSEIAKNQTQLKSIEKQLTVLRKDYAKTVVNSYKSKSKNSRLLFLLSSTDFLQAYKRLEYMNQYATFRKKQASGILEKKRLLTQLNDSIVLKKKVKDSLISIQLQEKKAIKKEKSSKENLLSKVKKNEHKYLAQIRKKQKQESAYEKQLKNIITSVISKSNKGKKSKGFVLTKESKKLASSFVKNKGKLPAPVAKGYVSRYFGQRKHEVMKKIDVKSSGWFYTTSKKAKARAVFKGTVKIIMVTKNTKLKTIIIQHGNYMTVYGNLESVYVQEGDVVKTKDNLGVIHTDATTNKTILKFQLWKDARAQNPYGWIYK